MTVLDLDDFHAGNHRLDLLDRLRALHGPGFRVTLFAVPSPRGAPPAAASWPTHRAWLRAARAARPWVEYGAHGWHHDHLECAAWGEARAGAVLDELAAAGLFAPVFRAPYWETSPGLYRALAARGWAVADHPRQAAARAAAAPGLRAYLLDGGPGRVHGHVQDVCGNGLAEGFARYAALPGPFRWVSEALGAP